MAGDGGLDEGWFAAGAGRAVRRARAGPTGAQVGGGQRGRRGLVDAAAGGAQVGANARFGGIWPGKRWRTITTPNVETALINEGCYRVVRGSAKT